MPFIQSIKFVNHPIFKTTKFNFCISGGSELLENTANATEKPATLSSRPAANIVLAGENGSGKTRLLEELYFGTKREYSVDAEIRSERQTIIDLDLSDADFYDLDRPETPVTSAKLIASSDSDSKETFYRVEFYADAPVKSIEKGENVKAAKTTESIKPVKAAKITATIEHPVQNVGEKSKHNRVTTFSLNSAYSTTEINYIAKRPVTNITNETLDSGRLEESRDVAREITQLIVDIASQDNDDLALAVRENPTKSVPGELLNNLRMRRFQTAFAKMFGDKLKYKTVKDNIVPVFEKDGQEVTLDALSSGEKQIVFRSTYLLRNINNLTGAPIFIDEPELSMHPKWAREIYGYYKNLFVQKKAQTSQIFMATHSADIIGAAIEDDSAVVSSLCLDCNNSHKYSKRLTDELLPTTTIAELKYFIFGIPSIDLHIQLFSYIQNTFVSGPALRTVDNFLADHGAPRKKSYHKGKTSTLVYRTLPTYVRNAIDHPEKDLTYTPADLEKSIAFMIALIRELRREA